MVTVFHWIFKPLIRCVSATIRLLFCQVQLQQTDVFHASTYLYMPWDNLSSCPPSTPLQGWRVYCIQLHLCCTRGHSTADLLTGGEKNPNLRGREDAASDGNVTTETQRRHRAQTAAVNPAKIHQRQL